MSLALALLLAAAPGAAFTEEERAFIARHKTLLSESADPCGLAKALEAEYRRILRTAPGPDAALVLAASVPLRLGEGLRLVEGFALFDPETGAVFLSSPAVSARLPQGACPTRERLAAFAFDTVGIYAHEAAHSFDRKDLGGDLVTTVEGEMLAYAREARLLSGLPRWPSKTVRAELERRALYAENAAILRKVEAMRETVGADGWVEEFQGHLSRLEEIRQRLEVVMPLAEGADRTAADVAEMVEEWRAGWPEFVHFCMLQLRTRPMLSDREKHLRWSREYLTASRKSLAEAKKGTLERELAAHAVKLAEQDVRFWGDAAQVERASEYYKARFLEIRPPPKEP